MLRCIQRNSIICVFYRPALHRISHQPKHRLSVDVQILVNQFPTFWRILVDRLPFVLGISALNIESLYSNPTISKKHTKVSYEVSKRAHHTKTISSTKFKNLYYPNISQAIKNAESFSTDFPDLFDNLGSNLPKLLNILGFQS